MHRIGDGDPGEARHARGHGDTVPLCVDLDRTLVRTDTLHEVLVQAAQRPGVLFRAVLALASRGKARFKAVLCEAGGLDAAVLPYRADVLAYVRAAHAAGREVVLATGAHRSVAEPIARHLGCFSRVIATDGERNLTGAGKRDALEKAFGTSGFDYIGDGNSDRPTFAAARRVCLVDPSPKLLSDVSATGKLLRVFSTREPWHRVFPRAIRIHQWVKNVLLAVPLVAAHRVLDLSAWLSVTAAFLAFSFVASAAYLVNDLLDLKADRLHPQKRFRPVASGLFPVGRALGTAAALALAGFAIARAMLPASFTAYLALYVFLTLTYSLYLKRRLLVDVLALASLYTLRVLAGAVAIEVVVSEWLLMFSLFLFLSLAFLKRMIELQEAPGDVKVPGRGYFAGDLPVVRAIGVGSGLLSALVLALYASSPAVSVLYGSPRVLWLLCPLLIYWVARLWFLAERREVSSDPVVFALRDRISYLVALSGSLLIALATVRWS